MATAPFLSPTPAPQGPYGVSMPSTQPGGASQAALTRGQAGGLVCTYSMAQSPSSVATVTSAEQTFTVIGGSGAQISIATTDLVIVNKPTAQAGLGWGNVRASAANQVGITVHNLSAGFLTPTASEVYTVVGLKGFSPLTASWSPVSVAANTTVEQQVSVPGLRSGELLIASKPTAQAGLDIVGARVVRDGVAGVTFGNSTAGVLTPTASETYTFSSLGGIDTNSPFLTYQVSVGTLTGVATATTAQQNVTLSALASTDIVLGVTKPTNQAGLCVVAGRVSSAGNLGIILNNVTAGTLTPTANEVYVAEIQRATPVAPFVLYQATISPASVAANTTAEQTFAVTGIIANAPVLVNKPTPQAGLGISGSRASSTNNIGITFSNFTATAITPTAGETYVVGQFQMPVDASGGSVLQSAMAGFDTVKVLANAMRTVLVNEGFMAGA